MSRACSLRGVFTSFTYCHLLCRAPNESAEVSYSRRLWGEEKKKRRKKPNEKEYRDERWDEGWSPGHVTGRRGAKRRTRRRPPPGASPAAPCLSLPVSIFFLLVFSYSYSTFTTLVFSGLRSFRRLRHSAQPSGALNFSREPFTFFSPVDREQTI